MMTMDSLILQSSLNTIYPSKCNWKTGEMMEKLIYLLSSASMMMQNNCGRIYTVHVIEPLKAIILLI